MSRLSNMCNSRGFLALRKEYSPLSLLRYYNLTNDGQFWTQVFEVGGEIGSFLLSACFPDDGKVLCEWWCPFEGKVSSEDEIVVSSFGLIWFNCDIPSPFSRLAIISRRDLWKVKACTTCRFKRALKASPLISFGGFVASSHTGYFIITKW